MLENYLPIFVFIVVSLMFGSVVIVMSKIIARFSKVEKPNAEKLSAYECGFEPFEEARTRFDVRFYLVAILFIVFDLEVAFLFPWAVIVRHIGWAGFNAMGIFLLLLVVGFIYEWKKGALDWE